MVARHQGLTVGDDHPSSAGHSVSVGVEKFERITQSSEDVLVHDEHGSLIRLEDNFRSLSLIGPHAVQAHESSVTICSKDRPAADVQGRGSLIVDFNPVLGWFDGIVVAIGQDFRDGEFG